MSQGNGAIPTPVEDPVVTVLKNLLNDAQLGRINTIAVIAVTPTGGVATPWVGPRLGDVYIGTALLQVELLRVIGNQPVQRPGLIRPAGAAAPGQG